MMAKRHGDSYEFFNVEDLLPEIEEMYMNKGTHAQVANLIGVSERTVIRWLTAGQPAKQLGERNPKYNPKYRKFYEAYDRGKRKNVAMLKSSAYDMALGGMVKTITKRTINPDGSVVVTEVEEKQLPHTGMLQFLLKNLCPEEFGDKQEITYTGTSNINNQFSGLDDDTLEQLKKIAMYQQQINSGNNSSDD